MWAEDKRQQNLKRHGIDFVEAEIIFAGLTLTFEDERFAHDERRYITIGMLGATVVLIAHTESEAEIRVISMRKATRNEQELYFHQLSHGQGSPSSDE